MGGFEAAFQAVMGLLIGIARLFIDFVVAVLRTIADFLGSIV